MKRNQMNRVLLLQLLVSCCLLSAIPAQVLMAQTAEKPASIFTFPHFVAFEDVSSGIAIFNPSPREASVTLTLTGWDGKPLGSPLTIKIPAKGQVAKTAGEIFEGSGDMDASLVMTSATAGILAFYQTFDSGGTFLDGADAVGADFTLVYPVVPGPQEGVSEIDILNPNIRPTAAELKLRSYSGDLLATGTVQIPAGGTYRAQAEDAFPPGTNFSGASHVVATSRPLNVFSQAQTIAGTSLFAGFSSVAEPGMLVDVAALNALPTTQLSTTGVLPFFRTGGSYASILTLANAEPVAVNVDLTAISNSGSTLGTRKVTLPPNGGFRSLLTGVFPPLAFGENEGWILVSASGRIYAALIHGRSDAASLTAIPLQKTPAFEFIAPQVLQGSGFHTEIALVNPSSRSAFADIFVVKANGETVSSTSAVLSPGARLSRRLDQLFPEIVSQSGGYVYVRSSEALFGAALIGNASGTLLTNVVFLPLTVPFTPAPQKSFFVAGRVNLDDKPAAGYQLELAGPVSGTATSGEDGTYIFKDLPAGKYSLTIKYPSSIEFVPPSTSFEITTANRYQDFQGFTKPSVWGVVTVNDRPSAGFLIRLSGPVSLTTTSAQDGSFLFKSLSAGNYTLVIEYQTGLQFVPSYVNFDLGRVSRRQDFAGTTEPNAIVIQPAALPVSGTEATVTIFGRDFNETSQVFVDLTRLKTTFVHSTLLNAVLPAYLLGQPQRFDVKVITDPGAVSQRTTKPFSFLVYLANPTLSSVTTPERIAEGGPGVTLTLAGTGFLPDTKVKINGSSDEIRTEVLSSTRIMAEVPALYFANGGIYPVVVENSYPTKVESNIQLLSVYYPAPAVQSVTPSAVPARLELSAEPLNIEVLGYGFRRGAVVLCNGEPLATTYCENDAYCLTVYLYARIPASMLRSSGFAQITVRNPDPSLAASEAIFVRIEGLQPTITSVVPGSATALNMPGQFSVPIVINGTNFGPQTSLRAYYNGATEPPPFAPPILLSSTQLYTTVQVDYASIGQWNAQVMNPQPGGGISQPMAFFITEGSLTANPFLIVLSPTSVSVGSPGFTIGITGTNFKIGARVQFKSTLLATKLFNDQFITAEVPAALLLQAGRVPVSVINPDNGGTSNRLFIDIQ